jgi:tripartite-type tricarboxylate transporter receptor subunit TctC
VTLARREFLQRAAGAAATLPALMREASAQNYPSRPVRLILGFPAGGSTDLVARIMAAWLTERLGQSVIVENKPGGGTNLAVQTAVNSPPDGYTLLFVTTTNAINATFYPTLPFNFLRDIDALPNSLPHIRSGALRALAVTGPARSAAVPDVPTLGETVQGYEVSGWTGIGVPAGTPAAIVTTLNREINAGLADARIAARLAEVGGRPIVASAEEFGQLWRRDTDKWAKVVKFAAAKRE